MFVPIALTTFLLGVLVGWFAMRLAFWLRGW
jgi:hypothetical protein